MSMLTAWVEWVKDCVLFSVGKRTSSGGRDRHASGSQGGNRSRLGSTLSDSQASASTNSGGLSVTGCLSDFSLYVFHPYGGGQRRYFQGSPSYGGGQRSYLGELWSLFNRGGRCCYFSNFGSPSAGMIVTDISVSYGYHPTAVAISVTSVGFGYHLQQWSVHLSQWAEVLVWFLTQISIFKSDKLTQSVSLIAQLITQFSCLFACMLDWLMVLMSTNDDDYNLIGITIIFRNLQTACFHSCVWCSCHVKLLKKNKVSDLWEAQWLLFTVLSVAHQQKLLFTNTLIWQSTTQHSTIQCSTTSLSCLPHWCACRQHPWTRGKLHGDDWQGLAQPQRGVHPSQHLAYPQAGDPSRGRQLFIQTGSPDQVYGGPFFRLVFIVIGWAIYSGTCLRSPLRMKIGWRQGASKLPVVHFFLRIF